MKSQSVGIPVLQGQEDVNMEAAFDLTANARAMHKYVLAMLSSNSNTHRAEAWRDDLVAHLESIREEIRLEEGGGGMCHVVTELLWDQRGWVRLPVSYLDGQGDLVCAGHLICALPDGSLLDATADQFGEGHSVRVIAPDHPDYGRYRPEFDEDVHPVSYAESFGDFFWTGEADFNAQDRLRRERGQGWWLQDKAAYIAYLQHQVEIGCEDFRYTLTALGAAQPDEDHRRAKPALGRPR